MVQLPSFEGTVDVATVEAVFKSSRDLMQQVTNVQEVRAR